MKLADFDSAIKAGAIMGFIVLFAMLLALILSDKVILNTKDMRLEYAPTPGPTPTPQVIYVIPCPGGRCPAGPPVWVPRGE